MSIRINRKKLMMQMVSADISVTDLAKKAEISIGTLSGIRSGRMCSEKTANAIADTLRVRLSDLLESSNES